MADEKVAGDVAPPTRGLSTTNDVEHIEAPITWKAYLICAFASFGGIFFGYDSGYINGVTGSAVFIDIIQGPGTAAAGGALSGPNNSLIVSILSAGTFFGGKFSNRVPSIGREQWLTVSSHYRW